MPAILLTNSYSAYALKIIMSELPPGFCLIAPATASQEALIRLADRADYLLVGGRVRIDGDVLRVAKRLKMIQRTGVGLDSMDLEAIRASGVPVYVNQGINATSVAEHTILLMLAALRRLPAVDSDLRRGVWRRHEYGLRSLELCGKTVGLIGMGNIGKTVCRMLKGFDVQVLYYDIVRLSNHEEEVLGAVFVEFAELVRAADIVSLHCPLNEQTRAFLGKDQFASMKEGAIVVNTARGGLIDEEALVQSLKSGRLGCAALDVFSVEPLPHSSELARLENVILTPHIGGITRESFRAMIASALNNIRLFEEGKLELIEDKRVRI